ncbi:hypothetical protein C1H46_027968 [Malus baccata]|uniref:Uncharacterized protein n=1 Tax=Malus baccata TaxID=106549 RepID=A0A540LJH7_MALBA|nr:hypothetical protein C1H46_027968 [Malus baccata]
MAVDRVPRGHFPPVNPSLLLRDLTLYFSLSLSLSSSSSELPKSSFLPSSHRPPVEAVAEAAAAVERS